MAVIGSTLEAPVPGGTPQVSAVNLRDIPDILPLLTPAEQEKLLAELDLLEKLKARKASQERFIKFVTTVWPSFIAGRHHSKMAEAFERVARGELKRLIINMPPRHRLDITEEIPTLSGWKTVANVQPGDYVFGSDGLPVLVTGKSAVYEEALYEVVTCDGQALRCDGEHLWTVRFGALDRPFVTLSTAEIFARLEKESWRKSGNLPLLPVLPALQYPERALLIDPYVLGVWLGDGGSYGASIGSSFTDKPVMRGQIEACGYKTTDNPKYQQFNVLGLYPQLRALGVLKNKHIPEEYLSASVAQREALLQGLIDTDGGVTTEGKVTFNNSNFELTQQVLQLLHSLGVKARITTRQTHYKGKPSAPSFRIMFKYANAARLPRKKERCRSPRGNWARSIDVRKLDRVASVQCLEVANPDGLFVAGRGHILTHNTKSEFASYLLPAWFLGKFPHKKVIQTSHTAELAVGFGRKVRNLVDQEVYKDIFPGMGLQADSKAAGRWNTNKGGDYFAIGVGGAVTGKGADLLIIDDPHSEQEAALAETSPDIYDKTYEWYTSGPRQRLQPGGAIVVVMCMTGDTGVLRPDGSETPLRDIRPGDLVATYENGTITITKVLNHRSNGVDSVFTVQTQAGRVFRANERHPFLVESDGERVWKRLKDLKLGDLLVSTKDVNAPQGLKQNAGYAHPARLRPATIEKTPPLHIDPWGTMGNIKGNFASLTGVIRPPTATTCVLPTITRLTGQQENTGIRQQSGVLRALSRVMGLSKKLSTSYLRCKEGFAQYVSNLLPNITPVLIGTGSCASITTTILGGLEGSCATTVTSPLGTEKPQKYSKTPLSTYAVELDPIVSITPAGREEVFDVQIERTENFIANGVVSHNTRWSKRDLTGQVLKAAAQRGGEEWEVIEFPALLPSGKPLWPEFWSIEELTALKEELPNSKWMAQYQQNPVSEASAIIKREWWQVWDSERPPPCEFVLMSWDTAFEATQRADYSALTTWGVFYKEDNTGVKQANIILLNAFRERAEFPRLKHIAIEQYKEWRPDGVIIEKKASGAPLIYELRAMGIPVQEFTPTRGNDKISRLNAVSDLFASGRVWVPDTHWAEEVVNEVAEFPAGEHDDYVDSVSMALMRFRKGGYVGTNLDEPEEPVFFKRAKQGYY